MNARLVFHVARFGMLMVLLIPGVTLEGAAPQSALGWPEPVREQRPWTRWWWLGSAVDRTNLTRQLEQFREAGVGGVEICPIYGVKGAEERFIDFLSPRWLEMLRHTTDEAKRLGLGVDLTTGTGWPFGGAGVTPEMASARVNLKRYEAVGGRAINLEMPVGRLDVLLAFPATGDPMELTDKVKDGRLEWDAGPGEWTLYALAARGPVQKVKRAAPGGEGNVLDPYSIAALNRYLAKFDEALEGFGGEPPRAHFHDSFEYYNAQWTPAFLEEFQQRRGYDLRLHLPALFGEGAEETVARVKADYRETISDLHLAYVRRWTEWCHEHGSRSRNQAHGSPGNLLDHYAAADIPETEVFGSIEGRYVPMNKLASSAAHLTGRNLVSAESFTWLNEHFQTSLDQAKGAADYLFLAGVNHIFFHGIPYSPADAPWPGWQFYAAVNLGPSGGLWHDLPAFNSYLTRCQSILQSGRPSADVLLYFPFHDFWQKPKGLMELFAAPGKWMESHPVYDAAMRMSNDGYAYDQISDQFLARAVSRSGRIELGGNTWKALVVPPCRTMPEGSLGRVLQLARDGATVLVLDHLPNDVPGLSRLERRRADLREMKQSVSFGPAENGVRIGMVGKGRLLLGSNLVAMLRRANVPREPMVEFGLHYIRRTDAKGHHYFIAHRGEKALRGWVTLGTAASSVVILDPSFENRAGFAAVRQGEDGSAQVYLQMDPGESRVLRTFSEATADGPSWFYARPSGDAQRLEGIWKVEFIDGGPELPGPFETPKLGSWSEQGGPNAERFAGTARYTHEFDHPAGEADDWRLELGEVAESARVRLNGRELGVLWHKPFRVRLGDSLQPGRNKLEVEVTNLGANRVRDLDRRGVRWKYFYDINVVGKNYRPLDASDWPVRDSGLIGPVTLTPLGGQFGSR